METPFPKIKARSLAGTEFTLLDAAQGQVTLIAIAFQRQAQQDSWLVRLNAPLAGSRTLPFMKSQ